MWLCDVGMPIGNLTSQLFAPGGLLLELAVCRPNGKSNKINACVNRAYSRLFVEVEV